MFKLVLLNEDNEKVRTTDVPPHKLKDVFAMMSDLYRIVPHDAIARKIWTPEDVSNELRDTYGYPADVIEDKGLVDMVLCQGSLQALDDCNDWDWEIIHQAIEDAGIEHYNNDQRKGEDDVYER